MKDFEDDHQYTLAEKVVLFIMLLFANPFSFLFMYAFFGLWITCGWDAVVQAFYSAH